MYEIRFQVSGFRCQVSRYGFRVSRNEILNTQCFFNPYSEIRILTPDTRHLTPKACLKPRVKMKAVEIFELHGLLLDP
jgi:hypothetical protein